MNSAKISYENKEIVGQNDKLSQEGNVAYGSYREVGKNKLDLLLIMHGD